MDINSIRLGFAYFALKQTLGENFSPISFADFSMAFLERRCGLTFFCSATRDALWIGLAEPSGALGTGLDEHSRAIKAKAEPAYLALSKSFERDYKNATATENRAAKSYSATEAPGIAPQSPTPPSSRPSTPSASSAPLHAGSHAVVQASQDAPRVMRAPRKPLPSGPTLPHSATGAAPTVQASTPVHQPSPKPSAKTPKSTTSAKKQI